MGSNDHHDLHPQTTIPAIDLSNISSESRLATVEWDALCKEVREACEDYGCFEVVYDKIPLELRAETFALIRKVFELPSEVKELNFNPKPYHSYSGVHSLYESLGIEDASNGDSLVEFASLMWPHHDNHHFCKTVGAITKQLEQLWWTVEQLILDGYGVNNKKKSKMMECKTLLRVMKYKAPPLGKPMSGLYGHTDKPLCTFLCDDRVSGLEIELKEDNYISVPIKSSSFIFIVGDPLMAWSNGRMHAVKHRVTMSGHEDRYSLGAFQVPVVGTVIGAPEELVVEASDGGHPKVFKEFDYMEFINYSLSKEGTDLPSHRMIHAFASHSKGN
ncbi:Probable 2-oxoglutarate-dependent dioxygenase AOP1.2 [Linum perenne]